MIGLDDNTPVAALTVGDLKDLIRELKDITPGSKAQRPQGKRLVYGIKGIEELFGCSHATAQHYKNTILQDAITQNGRKIVVDADYALELFGRRNQL